MPKTAPPRRISTPQAKVLKLLAVWLTNAIVGLAIIVGVKLVIISVGVGNRVGVIVAEIEGVRDKMEVGVNIGVIAPIRPRKT